MKPNPNSIEHKPPPRERPDWVIVNHSRGRVLLSRASRNELIDQIGHLEFTNPLRGAFLRVGAATVSLTPEHEGLLFDVLEGWVNEVGIEGMPEGLWDLRVALAATV
jgi:hypothetical protein